MYSLETYTALIELNRLVQRAIKTHERIEELDLLLNNNETAGPYRYTQLQNMIDEKEIVLENLLVKIASIVKGDANKIGQD